MNIIQEPHPLSIKPSPSFKSSRLDRNNGHNFASVWPSGSMSSPPCPFFLPLLPIVIDLLYTSLSPILPGNSVLPTLWILNVFRAFLTPHIRLLHCSAVFHKQQIFLFEDAAGLPRGVWETHPPLNPTLRYTSKLVLLSS